METAPSATVAAADDEEWQLVNDDGFVYKRKKRRVDPTSLVRPPDPAPDPAAEARHRARRKKKALFELKHKYAIEISLWENLSNTLKAMQEKASLQQRRRISIGGEKGEDREVREKPSGSWVNEILLQVEAQEEILKDFSRLCDAAESLCNVQDEKTKQAFLDLPLWNATPNELMASFSQH